MHLWDPIWHPSACHGLGPSCMRIKLEGPGIHRLIGFLWYETFLNVHEHTVKYIFFVFISVPLLGVQV